MAMGIMEGFMDVILLNSDLKKSRIERHSGKKKSHKQTLGGREIKTCLRNS